MAQLKNPQSQIPGGYRFLEPSTKWQPAPFSSLDSIVQQLISHRQGRPDLIQRNGWSLDRAVVYQEVAAYNVAVCQQNGWLDYIQGSADAVPFRIPHRSLAQKARAVAGGAETLVDWIASGSEAVSAELANKRAATCARMFPGHKDAEGNLKEACPLNKPGGLEAFFTVPVANAVRATMAKRKEMNLSTPDDDKLFVCEGCLCPLTFKVHLPSWTDSNEDESGNQGGASS